MMPITRGITFGTVFTAVECHTQIVVVFGIQKDALVSESKYSRRRGLRSKAEFAGVLRLARKYLKLNYSRANS
jgi:hypothetical protein